MSVGNVKVFWDSKDVSVRSVFVLRIWSSAKRVKTFIMVKYCTNSTPRDRKIVLFDKKKVFLVFFYPEITPTFTISAIATAKLVTLNCELLLHLPYSPLFFVFCQGSHSPCKNFSWTRRLLLPSRPNLNTFRIHICISDGWNKLKYLLDISSKYLSDRNGIQIFLYNQCSLLIAVLILHKTALINKIHWWTAENMHLKQLSTLNFISTC